MFYEFVCDACRTVTTVRAPMATGPTAPTCAAHGPMRRLYGAQGDPIIQWKAYEYVEKAARGEEHVPGMTTAQVRAIVHQATKHLGRGQQNTRRYRTLR